MDRFIRQHPLYDRLMEINPDLDPRISVGVLLVDAIDVFNGTETDERSSYLDGWLKANNKEKEAVEKLILLKDQTLEERIQGVMKCLVQLASYGEFTAFLKASDYLKIRQFEMEIGRYWRIIDARGKQVAFKSKPFYPDRGEERFDINAYLEEGITPQQMRAVVHRHLSGDGARYLLHVLECLLRERVDLKYIRDVEMQSIAEGRFTGVFHIRVELKDREQNAEFTLHAAKNEPSSDVLLGAYRTAAECYAVNGSYVPQPYLFGFAQAKRNQESIKIGIVAEEWMDGYKELHMKCSENGDRFIVWHSKDDHELLDDEDSGSVSEEIAKILTIYSDPENARSILSKGLWINGGDFVFRRNSATGSATNAGEISVKLTMVKGYEDRVDVPEFMHRLITLKATDAETEEGQALHIGVMTPLRAFKGILQGLIELNGKAEGSKKMRTWLTTFRESKKGSEYGKEIESFLSPTIESIS